MLPAETEHITSYLKSLPEGNKILDWEMTQITNCFFNRSYINNEAFNKEGEICSIIGLVYTGIFKVMICDDEKKKIKALHCNSFNCIVVDWLSFNDRIASTKTIFSKGESQLLCISETDFRHLRDTIPSFNTVCMAMIIHSLNSHTILLEGLENLPITDKINKVKKECPGMLNKINKEETIFVLGVGKNTFNKIDLNTP